MALAEQLVRHESGVLGLVTHAANHRYIEIVGNDGRPHRKMVRDSSGAKRPRAPVARRPFAESHGAGDVSTDAGECVAVSGRHVVTRTARSHGPCQMRLRRTARQNNASAVRTAAEEWRIHDLVASRALSLHQSSAPPAPERLAVLRARVLARQAGHSDAE